MFSLIESDRYVVSDQNKRKGEIENSIKYQLLDRPMTVSSLDRNSNALNSSSVGMSSSKAFFTLRANFLL